MDVVGTIAAFLAVLVVLVLVHELGHFIVAKRAGITVQEFGIGFPPRIGSVMWRGTRYSVNWIPLGGFVKMLGEDGEIEAERLRERGLSEPAVEKAMAGAFNRKPVWVRILVLLAGVAMNFLLAGVLFAVALSLPVPQGMGPLRITEIQADSPASVAGLSPGDVIVSADGRTFDVSRELTAYVRSRAEKEVSLGILRDGESMEITVRPRKLTPEMEARGLGPIGFTYEPERFVEVPSQVSGPIDAVARGFSEAGYLAWRIPGGLAEAVGGLLGLNPNAGTAVGPIGIAEETGRVLQAPLVSQLIFMGILSVNLAVLNVLPFPPLDGGRIAVVLIESLRRRRLPAEREALIYLTGFMVLIVLVILISIQDVRRLIEG
ncbi:MAG TPA: M50 family metallopeptidase [Candidatus Dormibacteraeota bacterium]|nr:M50 family metallopeptidase [Candidatus Dormibacteraeota bacterium]